MCFRDGHRCVRVLLLLLLLLLLFNAYPGNAAQNQEHYAVRPDGSKAIYYLGSVPTEEKRGIVLVLQGSGCNSVANLRTANGYPGVSPDAVSLFIEKYGMNDSLPWSNDGNREDCPHAYLVNNTIAQRVLDVLLVLSELRMSAVWWNGELIIVGGSAGVYVAEQVARLVPEADALVIFGFGGRRLMDDILHSIAVAFAAEGKSEAAAKAEQANVLGLFEAVREDPTKVKFASGHSYAYWAETIAYDQFNLLSGLHVPVLALQGTADQNASPQGAREMVTELQEAGTVDITFREYDGLDHSWRDEQGESHRDRVLRDIRGWLERGESQE